jgi:hypothetical protein
MANKSRKTRALAIIPRGRRSSGVPFGRSEMGVPGGDLTDIGCSDCRGVLAVREEGSQGHLAFTCRVGHAFSGESLLKAKEEQLEDGLWSAVEVYEELLLLHQEMAARARRNGVRPIAVAYQQRAKRAEAGMAALRALIERDRPATPDGKRG